jgi:peptidoglycan L-alanyl-D-glutamate endopeptidase CwlK
LPSFGAKSKERLATCDERLQKLLNEAIKDVDFSVLCGHRPKDEQDEAFRTGKSSLPWPKSKHNGTPSKAVDVAPYPIDWNDTARFARLAGYLERIAKEQGIKIRWGGDWNRNWRTKDVRFIDLPHIELED